MHIIPGHQAPFTVYYRLAIPGQTRLQSRWAKLRYSGKISRLLYETLNTNLTLTLALPGGGTRSDLNVHAFSDSLDGMAFKPQFGETPAQLVVPGFISLTTNPTQTYANTNAVLDNRFLPGPRTGPGIANAIPQAAIIAEVKTLKAIFDSAAVSVLAVYPDSGLKTFRIFYKGITYGDRGFHFPQ